jgi:hypothetical protein
MIYRYRAGSRVAVSWHCIDTFPTREEAERLAASLKASQKLETRIIPMGE